MAPNATGWRKLRKSVFCPFEILMSSCNCQYSYKFLCNCACTFIYICDCVCACIYICIWACICVCIWACICICILFQSFPVFLCVFEWFSTALCSDPHVKVSIRNLNQIFTTSPIFQQSHYFRQHILVDIWVQFHFWMIFGNELNTVYSNCSSQIKSIALASKLHQIFHTIRGLRGRSQEAQRGSS